MRMSHNIKDDVDKETLTPTDYAVQVFNIPTDAKDDVIKEICKNIDQDVLYDEIHVVKNFNNKNTNKIALFKEMNVQAKILKDMRTQELRRLKNL